MHSVTPGAMMRSMASITQTVLANRRLSATGDSFGSTVRTAGSQTYAELHPRSVPSWLDRDPVGEGMVTTLTREGDTASGAPPAAGTTEPKVLTPPAWPVPVFGAGLSNRSCPNGDIRSRAAESIGIA